MLFDASAPWEAAARAFSAGTVRAGRLSLLARALQTRYPAPDKAVFPLFWFA